MFNYLVYTNHLLIVIYSFLNHILLYLAYQIKIILHEIKVLGNLHPINFLLLFILLILVVNSQTILMGKILVQLLVVKVQVKQINLKKSQVKLFHFFRIQINLTSLHYFKQLLPYLKIKICLKILTYFLKYRFFSQVFLHLFIVCQLYLINLFQFLINFKQIISMYVKFLIYYSQQILLFNS